MCDRDVEVRCLDSLKIPNILKTKLKRQMPEDDKIFMKKLSIM